MGSLTPGSFRHRVRSGGLAETQNEQPRARRFGMEEKEKNSFSFELLISSVPHSE